MRTKTVTVVCTLLFLIQGFALFSAIISFFVVIDEAFFNSIKDNPLVASLTVNSALYGIAINALILVSVYGLWLMKRWSVYLFSLILIIGLIVIHVVQPSWMATAEQSWWLPFIIPTVYYLAVIKNWTLLK